MDKQTRDFQPRPFTELGVDPRSIRPDPGGFFVAPGLSQAAMRLLSAFNWADHGLGSLVTVLAHAAPRVAFDLLYGLHSDGIRRGLAVDFIRSRLRAEDKPIFEGVWPEMNWLYGARNVLAHWLWHASLARRDVLVLINAPFVAADVVRWQEAMSEAQAIQDRAAVPLLIQMPDGTSSKAAGYMTEEDLKGLTSRVMNVHNLLRFFRGLVEMRDGSEHIEQLREAQMIQVRKIPPLPSPRPRLGRD